MIANIAATHWKPQETSGTHVVTQRDFGGLAEVKQPRWMPADIAAKQSFSDALYACLLYCGETDEAIAERIPVCKGYLSKLLRGMWEKQCKRLLKFMRETQCVAPLQVMARDIGCELVAKASQAAEIAELRQRLNDMERTRA